MLFVDLEIKDIKVVFIIDEIEKNWKINHRSFKNKSKIF